MRAYLVLLRPANVTTAVADVLAGYAVARLGNAAALPWLILSTACLYAGGIALNDVFDRHIDRVERPERPIPSGRVPVAAAGWLGGGLLAAGAGTAWLATPAAGTIALAIAGLVLLYDVLGKRHDLIGPLNMAACRALNLLLGVAAVPAALRAYWPIAVIPLLYIWAVTTLSRGEVHGGTRRGATAASISLALSVAALAATAIQIGEAAVPALVITGLVGWRVGPPFLAAWTRPSPGAIRRAVKRGVLSLVLVDAAIAAAFGSAILAATILGTGLVAARLARKFAVT